MASLAALANGRKSIKKTHFLLALRLFPNISSSLLSSLCESHHFSSPSLSQTPPVPKKLPFTVSAHGRTWQDPYHWMSNTNDPDFIDYLHQENSYAEAFMADTKKLRQTLFSEMTRRMPSNISTPPERWGPWLYYQYIPEGKEYPVLCRKLASRRQGWGKTIVNHLRRGFWREEILLNWNEIAEQYGYVHVGTCQVSPDHNFLAYTLDISGGEQFMLQIKDIQRSCVLPEFQVHGVVGLAWAQDGCTLFYTLCDKNQRPYRVQCMKLGANSVDDIPIFTEYDSSFCVDITTTKDGKFITVNSNSRTSSEVYVINAVNPQDGLQKFCKRAPGVQYFLEHHHGFFYILTNAPIGQDKEFSDSGNYYLARCRAEHIQSANLENIIVPSEDISLQDMDIFNEHLVLFLCKKGSPAICSINMPIDVNCENGKKMEDFNPWFFPVPSNSCGIVPGSNHDFMSSIYRAVLSSPVMPDVVVDYDMLRKTFSVVEQDEVLGVFPDAGLRYLNSVNTDVLPDIQNDEDKDDCSNGVQGWWDLSDAYACERKEVVSHDGVRIPLTILYSQKAHQRAQSPGILHGYGAYGEVLDKTWCADRLSLLDRGWVVAFADVRGGGGADASWHRSGSGMHKLNSIHDFVSCGRYLVSEGYVHEKHLGAIGYSAGSLLVGAAINMHTKLFRAAILKVPFLDICNTLLDPSLPLTILDYEEFGNPQIQSQFESILKYSPYDNIPGGVCCPAMLVTASFNDSRVGVWEAAKWVAKVRDSTCSNCSLSVILKTNMSGGHFGESGRFGQCEETAYDYAFLMKSMGMCATK